MFALLLLVHVDHGYPVNNLRPLYSLNTAIRAFFMAKMLGGISACRKPEITTLKKTKMVFPVNTQLDLREKPSTEMHTHWTLATMAPVIPSAHRATPT